MANHFVVALGLEVGKSLLEPDGVPIARKVIDRCKERGVYLVLPSDFVVAPSLETAAKAQRRRDERDPGGPGRLRRRPEDARDVPRG